MSFGSSKVRFTPRLLPRGGGAWSGDRWAAGRGPRVRAAAVPWRSACCVLLGHHHSLGRARPGPAGRSLSSRVRAGGRISGPRPCHFTEEEVATPDHAILGSQAFAVGAGEGASARAWGSLEPLLSAGDDMLRVELGTCVKGWRVAARERREWTGRSVCADRRADSRTWGESSSTLDSHRSVSAPVHVWKRLLSRLQRGAGWRRWSRSVR